MDVCINSSGVVQKSIWPGHPDCTRRREARAGERLYYTIRNHPDKNTPCQIRQGRNQKFNVPITLNGVTRVGSFFDTGQTNNSNCPYDSRRGVFGNFSDNRGNLGTDRVSIHGFNNNAVFIMASGSNNVFFTILTNLIAKSIREILLNMRRAGF